LVPSNLEEGLNLVPTNHEQRDNLVPGEKREQKNLVLANQGRRELGSDQSGEERTRF
jgi:hypothetical protein